MEIEPANIKIRDLVDGYTDNDEEGVFGFGGRLDIRPPYQREFVYNDKEQKAVIDTILKGYPLNVMYWSVRDDGGFEIIDGQQRTLSICKYIKGDFSFDNKFYHNLTDEEQEKILDYELMIYRCTGTHRQKLDWFQVINIASKILEKQELRNAVYSGSWVSSAKHFFSKRNCPAYGLAKDYVRGEVKRQKYLETAIAWISCDKIDDYMAKHQHDQNANKLWNYFQSVINWVEATFKPNPKLMRGVDWGMLYKRYKDSEIDTEEINKKIEELLHDDDVENKRGIYYYVLTGDERYLDIRTFSEAMKMKAYDKQDGMCNSCKKKFDFDKMEGDHIIPWKKDGKTVEENCQMLCRKCNRTKAAK